jgi:hypothetical protein
VILRRDAKLSTTIMQDWKLRFIDSYDVQLQDWIEAAKAGKEAPPPARSRKQRNLLGRGVGAARTQWLTLDVGFRNVWARPVTM